MTTPATPAPAPTKGSNRVLLIILCVLGGLFLLVGGCAVGCTWLVGRKAKSYAESAQKNPQVAALALAATLHPNLEVVSKDETAGRITLRNKTTGEVAKLDFANLTPERANEIATRLGAVTGTGNPSTATPVSTAAESNAAPADNSASDNAASTPTEEVISPAKAAALALTMKKFPSAVPVYPHGRTTDAAHKVFAGNTLGTYVFTTADSAADVVAFYEKRGVAEGYAVISNDSGSNDFGATAVVALNRQDPRGSITVAAEPVEGGRVRAVLTLTIVTP